MLDVYEVTYVSEEPDKGVVTADNNHYVTAMV